MFTLCAGAENTEDKLEEEVINVIKLLEIANGDENGNMNFDKNVTRAEFVKMAISASPSKDEAAGTKLNISLFPDVKNNFWGASYIYVAINNGLVNGYIDGTFRPSNPVKLEEAATIVLRLLGYTSADFTGNYPASQIKKYTDLELDKGIEASVGDSLTRRDCMLLLYNALSAKTKSGQIYCSTLGYGTDSEGKLDYSQLLEDKLEGPVIFESTLSLSEYTGMNIDTSTPVQLNNSTSSVEKLKSGDVVYYSSDISTIYAYRKTATGVVESVSFTSGVPTIMLSGKNYQIATTTAKSKLSLGGKYNSENSFVTLILGINDSVVDVTDGDMSKIDENTDNATYTQVVASTMKGPFIAGADASLDRLTFDLANAKIYYKNAEILKTELRPYDVYYFSEQLNTIWVYRHKVSGTIEALTPVTSPTSVTIAGRTLSIESSKASYDLSNFGAFRIGDTVTALLGMDGKVAGIVPQTEVSGVYYGVITDIGKKTYTDDKGLEYTSQYLTVTDTAANTFTYRLSNTYYNIGDVVKVSFADNNVRVSLVKTEIKRGSAASVSLAIKNGDFAEDCEIIDVKGGTVKRIYPSRISGIDIDVDMFIYSTVTLYYNFDENHNLTHLILKDFTGDLDEYGVVTSSSNGNITYMTSNIKQTVSTEGACSAGPATLNVVDGRIIDASPLMGYIDNIETITMNAVYDEKDRMFKLSDEVKVFIKTADSYSYTTLEDVIAGEYDYKAYYDKSEDMGGRIRIIIATRAV